MGRHPLYFHATHANRLSLPQTLNIIGPGRVGRTLATLWKRAGVFAIQDVLSGAPESARTAVASIGTGDPVARVEDMRAADVWMLTTPDDRIVECAAALAATGALRAGDVVFHCSGALSSTELLPAGLRGAHAASIHPVKSFAEPVSAVSGFAGTWCAAEGHAAALAVLEPAFEQIGARITRIDAASKLVYHAGSVIVSNYLVALMDAGLRCYERAGIPRGSATLMMEPLVRETADNVFQLGTGEALTGPIARGDEALVAQQLHELAKWDADIAGLYRALGAIAVDIARGQGESNAAALERIRHLLRSGE